MAAWRMFFGDAPCRAPVTWRAAQAGSNPFWGAIKIAVSILCFTGDPNSTLELAAHLWLAAGCAIHSVSGQPLQGNLLSAIVSPYRQLTVIALSAQGKVPGSAKPTRPLPEPRTGVPLGKIHETICFALSGRCLCEHLCPLHAWRR